jgi:uncharacterized DUF497 family protein
VLISFDLEKDACNREQQKLALAFGEAVLTHLHGEVEDRRQDYDERRMKAYGRDDGLWFHCCYTQHGPVTHIFTVHRVTEKTG